MNKLTAQTDELKVQVHTFLKSKLVDFDCFADRTSSLYSKAEELNRLLQSTTTLIKYEVCDVVGPKWLG